MRYLALGEVVVLHRRLLETTGGTSGIRDFGALESAVAQPKGTFGGVDLYPALVEKAAARMRSRIAVAMIRSPKTSAQLPKLWLLVRIMGPRP